MIKITDRLPKRGQVVVAFLEGEKGDYIFARYDRVLTWGGFRVKFLNLMSKGLWRNDVVGWLPIPGVSSTYKPAELVRKACIKAYNMDFDQLREFYGAPEESYLMEKWHTMQHDFSRWFCDLDSAMAEKFMEGL